MCEKCRQNEAELVRRIVAAQELVDDLPMMDDDMIRYVQENFEGIRNLGEAMISAGKTWADMISSGLDPRSEMVDGMNATHKRFLAAIFVLGVITERRAVLGMKAEAQDLPQNATGGTETGGTADPGPDVTDADLGSFAAFIRHLEGPK